MVAVAVCGLSTTLLRVVGPKHVHTAAAAVSDPMAQWRDFRRTAQIPAAQPRPHTHSIFQRHHHEHDDTSVVTLDRAGTDATASADAGASALGMSLVFALAPVASWPVCAACRGGWHALPALALKSRDPAPLERPPKG